MWLVLVLLSGFSLGQDVRVDPYLQQRIQNLIDRQSPADYVTKEEFRDFAELHFVSEEDEEEFRKFRQGNLTFIKFLIEVMTLLSTSYRPENISAKRGQHDCEQ